LQFFCGFRTSRIQMWADSVSSDCDFIPYTQMPKQQFPLTISPDCFFTYTFNTLFRNSFSFYIVQSYNLNWNPVNVIIDTKIPFTCSDVRHRLPLPLPVPVNGGTPTIIINISDVTSRPFRIIPSCHKNRIQQEITYKKFCYSVRFGRFWCTGPSAPWGLRGALSTPLYLLTLAKGCSRFFLKAGSHLGTTWCAINHQTKN
jgi:hypothetical protein